MNKNKEDPENFIGATHWIKLSNGSREMYKVSSYGVCKSFMWDHDKEEWIKVGCLPESLVKFNNNQETGIQGSDATQERDVGESFIPLGRKGRQDNEGLTISGCVQGGYIPLGKRGLRSFEELTNKDVKFRSGGYKSEGSQKPVVSLIKKFSSWICKLK